MCRLYRYRKKTEVEEGVEEKEELEEVEENNEDETAVEAENAFQRASVDAIAWMVDAAAADFVSGPMPRASDNDLSCSTSDATTLYVNQSCYTSHATTVCICVNHCCNISSATIINMK